MAKFSFIPVLVLVFIFSVIAMTCCADNTCITRKEGYCDLFACRNWCVQDFNSQAASCQPDNPVHPTKYACICVHKCSI
ncbi:SLR1 pollen coat protein [Medicago truncatula]|uniref:SLR1 pollen coat protein n=1 Tax=Medicago truncatula TaxID=3880 RepID=A0A072VHI9_MEDTR|nr:SLR1 pollen coat protein [Medicago truncatula]